VPCRGRWDNAKIGFEHVTPLTETAAAALTRARKAQGASRAQNAGGVNASRLILAPWAAPGGYAEAAPEPLSGVWLHMKS